MMNPPNILQEKLQYARETASIVGNSFAELIGHRTVLEPALNDQALIASYNQTLEANALNQIRYTLYRSLIVDSYSLVGDPDQRSCTIQALIAHLRDPSVVAVIRQEYVRPHAFNWVDTSLDQEQRLQLEATIRAREGTQLEEEFDRILPQTFELWDKFAGSPLFDRIKKARNKILAHRDLRIDGAKLRLWEFKDLELKWGDCEKYIDTARPIVENLGLLIASTNYGFDSSTKEIGRVAEAFWKTCRGPGGTKG
jgi:hypothetical protein